MVVLRALACVAALAGAGAAQAHVSVQPATAAAGAYQVLRFGVGHGCDGEATTSLRLVVPPGVTVARPQPKPGWTLDVETAGDVVTAVVWRGALPAQQFDEFLLLVKLPGSAGPLAFPAVQTCGARESRWVEIGEPGAPRPSHPAPSVILTPPPSPESGHDHHR